MTEATHFYQAFQPAHYELYLAINRANKTITGKTTITGEAKQTAIALHQKYLKVSALQADGQDVPFTIDDPAEAIRITLPQSGKVTLTIDYTAPLTDTMMGIYPSYYVVDGV